MHLIDFNNPAVMYYMAALLMAVPLARIFMRAGFKPYWIALLVVPDAGLVLCLTVLALGKWRRMA
jgi:hypothetical protein